MGPRELKGKLVGEENRVSPENLRHPADLVPKGPKEVPVNGEKKGHRALQAHPALRVLQVIQDQREFSGLKVIQVFQEKG